MSSYSWWGPCTMPRYQTYCAKLFYGVVLQHLHFWSPFLQASQRSVQCRRPRVWLCVPARYCPSTLMCIGMRICCFLRNQCNFNNPTGFGSINPSSWSGVNASIKVLYQSCGIISNLACSLLLFFFQMEVKRMSQKSWSKINTVRRN